MLLQILKHFFVLGCFSFGGPAAHLGYFKKRFVDELRWLSDEDYGQIVALSQFLPGPGSSQTGFAIGYQRAGLMGGMCAFFAFTLPSVLLMILLATFGNLFTDAGWYNGVIHHLKLLAVVVVADATYGMFNSFCRNRVSQSLCIATAIILMLVSSIAAQMLVLVFAALIGVFFLAKYDDKPKRVESGKPNLLPLILFILLLVGLPLLANINPFVELSAVFFSAGSLVFGGGHVVLPMLQNMLGDCVSNDVFLTGYAAAQGVPGPMFTLATWLGYHLSPGAPIVGALLATAMVFLPGFLLLVGVLNYWQNLAHSPSIKGAVNGVNASVTGLLLAALYQPVFTSAVIVPMEMVIVLVGLLLLKTFKLPIIAVVGLFLVIGAL